MLGEIVSAPAVAAMGAEIETGPAPGHGRRCGPAWHIGGSIGRQRRRGLAELVGNAAAQDIDGVPAGAAGEGLTGEDELCAALDRAEVVVQVLDTPDPVGGVEPEFTADARNPAEAIVRLCEGPHRCWRQDGYGRVGPVDALPGEARRGVEQHVRARGGDNAGANAGRAEVFDVVACDEGLRAAAAQADHRGRAVAADSRGAAVYFNAREPAAALPVVAGMSAGKPAFGIDAVDRHRREEVLDLGKTVASPTIAAVGAEIEAGPTPGQRRRGQGLHGQIRRQCRAGDQDGAGDRSQQEFPRHFLTHLPRQFQRPLNPSGTYRSSAPRAVPVPPHLVEMEPIGRGCDNPV